MNCITSFSLYTNTSSWLDNSKRRGSSVFILLLFIVLLFIVTFMQIWSDVSMKHLPDSLVPLPTTFFLCNVLVDGWVESEGPGGVCSGERAWAAGGLCSKAPATKRSPGWAAGSCSRGWKTQPWQPQEGGNAWTWRQPRPAQQPGTTFKWSHVFNYTCIKSNYICIKANMKLLYIYIWTILFFPS